MILAILSHIYEELKEKTSYDLDLINTIHVGTPVSHYIVVKELGLHKEELVIYIKEDKFIIEYFNNITRVINAADPDLINSIIGHIAELVSTQWHSGQRRSSALRYHP